MSYYKLPEEVENHHPAVAGWFLGPVAENFPLLKDIFNSCLEAQKDARQTTYPDDKAFITPAIQSNALFKKQIKDLKDELLVMSRFLADHSVPFWSPRYNGHMNMDSSFPALMGYLVTMLYNPNNVATEASPFTTILEKVVGEQLCKMLGYHVEKTTNRDAPSQIETSKMPNAWGHITCDGSVANLEAIWAARNLKFYPLSFRAAMGDKGPLEFLKNVTKPFEIKLCTGRTKAFTDCDTWDLLNLTPETVLGIPQQLYDDYGVSQTFLQNALSDYLIQSNGMTDISRYGVKEDPVMYVGTTKHYSWPKGGAIAGIGKNKIIDVPVDLAGRMDVLKLDEMLRKRLNDKTPVYAVVAIMGSTEQGAVDPLKDIVEIRKKYQAEGLSFIIHCDAAWGGYFATMLREPSEGASLGRSDGPAFVPTQTLPSYTEEHLREFRNADSITIDPHKSGYVQYPAGGLCYRDGRMRYLITWTSPIVFHKGDENESIGVYGVEGSKPGAAPAGAFLSHEVIGLHRGGYGLLLGEAMFTCTKLYSHWVTMDIRPSIKEKDQKVNFVVVPFNMLPEEKRPGHTPETVREQKERIYRTITNRPNEELIMDKKAMELFKELGSDLMINSFAVNFKINGKVNQDIGEANDLNQRIFRRTSVMSIEDKVSDRPILLTSTTMAQDSYKECLTNYKDRLGLVGEQDLVSLVNVTMSPWPTQGNFLKEIVDDFQKIVEEEVEGSLIRNTVTPDTHGFVIQGTDKLFFVHLPMFYMANHRVQLIFTGDLPADVQAKYVEARRKYPTDYFLLDNAREDVLANLLKEGGSFVANVRRGLPDDKGSEVIAENITISNVHVVIRHSMATNALTGYPLQMAYHLYGTEKQHHIDHVLLAAPNQQLNSDQVKLEISSGSVPGNLFGEGNLIAVFDTVFEQAMQPMIQINSDPKSPDYHKSFSVPSFNFAAGQSFKVSIYESYEAYQSHSRNPLARGTLTLGTTVFTDVKMLMGDPAEKAPAQEEITEGLFAMAASHKHVAVSADTSEAQTITSSADTGLSAEYPVNSGVAEYNVIRKNNIMRGWREAWEEARVETAHGRGFASKPTSNDGFQSASQGILESGVESVGNLLGKIKQQVGNASASLAVQSTQSFPAEGRDGN